jgi:hypothetical protein
MAPSGKKSIPSVLCFVFGVWKKYGLDFYHENTKEGKHEKGKMSFVFGVWKTIKAGSSTKHQTPNTKH